jgi:hypothetical protein
MKGGTALLKISERTTTVGASLNIAGSLQCLLTPPPLAVPRRTHSMLLSLRFLGLVSQTGRPFSGTIQGHGPRQGAGRHLHLAQGSNRSRCP